MKIMSAAEWREFVSLGTRTGKLAVTRKDGSPHVVPIWFVLDGDSFLFNTGKASLKGRILGRDPRVSMCVDDDTAPYAFVMLNGVAELSDDLDESLHWATKIGERYMGAERGAEFGRRNAVPEEYLVRVRITKVVAQAEIAS